MPQQIEFEGQVHEFPDDFTDEDISAALGSAAPAMQEASSMPGSATAATGLGLAAMKMAPGVVSGVNKMAGAVMPLAKGAMKGRAGIAGMMTTAGAVGGQVAQGNYSGAAKTAAGAVAMSQVPKVLGVVQRMTAPAQQVLPNGVKVMLKSGGGALARGAGAIGKAAGSVAPLLTAASMTHDVHEALMARANDPQTSPEEREAILRVLTRATGGSRSR